MTDDYTADERASCLPLFHCFVVHMVSTAGRWLSAWTLLGFFSTYVWEFDKFQLEVDTNPLVPHMDEEPIESFPKGAHHS